MLSLIYFNISAFVPLYVEDNFKDNISTKMVGILDAAMELAGALCSPMHGLTIPIMGRKNAWLLGILSTVLGSFLLGF